VSTGLKARPATASTDDESRASIQGLIHDDQHKPVPEVRVVLDSTALHVPLEVESSSDGRFRFVELPPGTYSLELYGDSRSQKHLVTLAADEQKRLEVRLLD